MNDEPENLMILPPIDESLTDKIILFKAVRATLPCETETHEGRERCMGILKSELPAFAAALMAYEIPEALRSARYGVKAYHHPDLLHTLAELAPESKLAELIDRELFPTEAAMAWTGTAAEIESRLTSSDAIGYEARRLLSFNTACGVYLGRLATKHPDRYERQHTRSGNSWTIRAPEAVKDVKGFLDFTAKDAAASPECERGERLFPVINKNEEEKERDSSKVFSNTSKNPFTPFTPKPDPTPEPEFVEVDL